MKNTILEIEKRLYQNQLRGIRKICLFLDFDGVINTFLQEGSQRYIISQQSPEQFEFCDSSCINNLNVLCEKRDIDIVISSTWRFSGLDFCKEYLKNHGFQYTNRVVGTTQMDWHDSREQEILNYMAAHPIYRSFVVLDDMKILSFKKYLVETNSYFGFDQQSLQVALRITDI